MTPKQQYSINAIFSKIPLEQHDTFRQIADCAISLGYMPSIKGAKEQYANFQKGFGKPKIYRTLLKIVADPKQLVLPTIEMRFFANTFPYSPLFARAIRDRVYWNMWADPCQKIHGSNKHACWECDSTHVYYTTNSEGEKVTHCGYTSLVYLSPECVNDENVPEIVEAFHKMDEFYETWTK